MLYQIFNSPAGKYIVVNRTQLIFYDRINILRSVILLLAVFIVAFVKINPVVPVSLAMILSSVLFFVFQNELGEKNQDADIASQESTQVIDLSSNTLVQVLTFVLGFIFLFVELQIYLPQIPWR